MAERTISSKDFGSRLDLRKALMKHFGYSEFKTSLQREAVECVFEGKRKDSQYYNSKHFYSFQSQIMHNNVH